MKRRSVFSLLLALALGAAAALAQDLPPADAVLATLRRVNDRFLAANPDPGADLITDRARPSNIWTRATYFEGLMALQRVAPEPRYVDYAVRWAGSHNWDLAYGAADVRHADNQCCGQTYLDLYALDPQPERIAKIKAAIDGMVASAKQDDWWWIDAIQMAMPVFARLGVLTGDGRYFEKMHALFRHTMTVQGGRGLYNPAEHLWWRDADFDPPYQEPNGAHCYWSRGNGWVFAGLARVLDVLPADAPHRAEYVTIFQDMAAALVPLQRIDGYWNASLKDPDNYGGRELTGTAFFAYGMAWGIRQGLLPRADYLPVVARAWRGLAGLAVRPDGSLGYVQGTGKQPSDGQPVTFDSVPNFDDFGTGAFLLAGSEVHRLSSVPAIDHVGIFRTYTKSPPLPSVVDWYSFIAEVRGTNLPAIFGSTPPRLVLPDGKGEEALEYQPATGAYRLFRTFFEKQWELAAAYPAGVYRMRIADQAIDGLTLEPAGWPPLPALAVAHGSAARPVTVAVAALSERVRLELGATGIAAELVLPGGAGARAQLELAPFVLPTGDAWARAQLEQLSLAPRVVNLGQWGAPVVEAGQYSSATSQWFHFGGVSAPEKLANLSARGQIAAGGDLTTGFVVSAGGPKMVLVRAAGPALQGFGVGNALANPYLRVFNASRTRAWQNDDWQSGAQYLALDAATGATTLQASYSNPRGATVAAGEAGAFPLAARSRDAAIVLVLPPGGYTAQVTGVGNSAAGAALLEVYELTTTQTNPRLTNLSARGVVGPGEPLITGFVIAGGPKRVLLRAIGPSLEGFGLPAAGLLASPRLTVIDGSGRPVGGLAPVDATTRAFRDQLGAFALRPDGDEAEQVATLPPGAYTVQAAGAGGGSGTVLVEIYTAGPDA